MGVPLLAAVVGAYPPPVQVVRAPPLEEHLAQNTLWPEVHKLYGHGNDVHALTTSPDGRYMASACKAQVGGRQCLVTGRAGSH